MEQIKSWTLIQWIGIAVGLNSLLMGATPQLTVLFGAAVIPYIGAIATLGNGALGVFVTVIGGQGSQVRNVVADPQSQAALVRAVLAMPGIEHVSVNALASPKLASVAVDPTVDKIAPTIAAQATVAATAKAAAAVLLLALVLTGLFAGDARAQIPRQRPALTGNIANDIAAATAGGTSSSRLTGNPLGDIIGALDVKLLPDLQYALKLATASGSKVTGPCYQAWIDIINTRQAAVNDPAGQALPMPDPHIVTDFEKLVELRNSLQPDSEFMIKCSPVASMVKKDIVGFIGIVLSGGAGLATLVPGL